MHQKKHSQFGRSDTTKINAAPPLQIGDLVTVRLIITAKTWNLFIFKRPKSLFCFEPVNVLSEYQYKGGLDFTTVQKMLPHIFFFDSINKNLLE
jgi:hypothetical protein